MKILIDARLYGLENTGIGRYLINLIKELNRIKTDQQFTVLLRRDYYRDLQLESNWKKIQVDIGHYTLEEQVKLPFIINKEKADLVHFPHLNVPIFYKGKYILTCHDLTMQKQGRNASKLPLPVYYLKRGPFLYIAEKAINGAVRIIVPSMFVSKSITSYYGTDRSKISVINEGIDKDKYLASGNLGELETLAKYGLVNKNYFFYVGKVYPHKNVDIVIKAIKNLNESKEREALFVIAGAQDEFMGRLVKLINSIRVKDYIKLLGFVKDEDLRILYRYALGCVYPSLSEGFGLQGLEAIASGSTLLCSNIETFKEIYGRYAFYFNPMDVNSVSSTMFSVLNMSELDKRKYINSAQKFIDKYSWTKMAEETLSVYHSALE